MDIYFEMAKHPVFTIEDVNLFFNNMNSSRSAVKRITATSKALKIRNNLYQCRKSLLQYAPMIPTEKELEYMRRFS